MRESAERTNNRYAWWSERSGKVYQRNMVTIMNCFHKTIKFGCNQRVCASLIWHQTHWFWCGVSRFAPNYWPFVCCILLKPLLEFVESIKAEAYMKLAFFCAMTAGLANLGQHASAINCSPNSTLAHRELCAQNCERQAKCIQRQNDSFGPWASFK